MLKKKENAKYAPCCEVEDAYCSPPTLAGIKALCGVVNMGLHPVVPDMLSLLVVSVITSCIWLRNSAGGGF
jgi:hypothetical protein